MPRALLAVLTALPVALLGGLIGLGGAEFRLPLLTGLFGYAVRAAIPLNLVVSLVTLATALLIRLRTTPLEALAPHVGSLLSLSVGSVLGAYLGTGLAKRLSDQLLERVVFSLLLGIGLLLLGEAFFPFSTGGLGLSPLSEVPIGVVLGVGIGIFSSLLGVAGGELLIPTLLLVFGLDIKLTGTGSALISLPTVVTGILRWRTQGAYQNRKELNNLVAPMAVGSIVGTLLGGVFLASAPTAALKFGLGIILLLSAAKTLRNLRRSHTAP